MADTNRIFPSQFTQIGNLAANDYLLIADSSQTGQAEKLFLVSIDQIVTFTKENVFTEILTLLYNIQSIKNEDIENLFVE